MDPIILATATSALTLLGTETAKGLASQAGKDVWSKAKGLMGWTNEPDAPELPRAIATTLQSDEALLAHVIKLLADAKAPDSSVQMAASLVGTLTAEKVVIGQKIENIQM